MRDGKREEFAIMELNTLLCWISGLCILSFELDIEGVELALQKIFAQECMLRHATAGR